uniref:Ankyrin repeat protein n=1 Tax=Pithovirus LCPAC302 TaxID=2506593 RepID=A0A481Z6Z5_9VIRU|nr:MAG: ankyrin repeat protein [Pithovirus LCPAC302]
MEDLSDDLLIYMLSYVDKKMIFNLLMTCKRFYRLAYGKLNQNRIGWMNKNVLNEGFNYKCNNNITTGLKRILSDPRVDLTYNSNSSIKNACFKGFSGIVEVLLSDPRIDPNPDGYNMMIVCNPETNGDPNLFGKRCNNFSHIKILKMLLDKGVKPSIVNFENALMNNPYKAAIIHEKFPNMKIRVFL